MQIMRTIAAVCMAALAIGVASAVAAPKNQTGIVSGGTVLAPSGLGTKGTSAQVPTAGTFTPLTAEECTGLGGTVTFTSACAAKGRFACATVDPNGVVRKVCLTK